MPTQALILTPRFFPIEWLAYVFSIIFVPVFIVPYLVVKDFADRLLLWLIPRDVMYKEGNLKLGKMAIRSDFEYQKPVKFVIGHLFTMCIGVSISWLSFFRVFKIWLPTYSTINNLRNVGCRGIEHSGQFCNRQVLWVIKNVLDGFIWVNNFASSGINLITSISGIKDIFVTIFFSTPGNQVNLFLLPAPLRDTFCPNKVKMLFSLLWCFIGSNMDTLFIVPLRLNTEGFRNVLSQSLNRVIRFTRIVLMAIRKNIKVSCFRHSVSNLVIYVYYITYLCVDQVIGVK